MGSQKSLAIAGLVLSIIFGIPGLIVSAIALSNMKKSGNYDGKGFAVAGMVIGIIVLVISLGLSCLLGCAGCFLSGFSDALSGY